jgi:hypothetical protein
MGTGMSSTAIHPSKVEAYWIPIPLNICCAKRGKTAPQRERRKVFAAMAEAANYDTVSKNLTKAVHDFRNEQKDRSNCAKPHCL